MDVEIDHELTSDWLNGGALSWATPKKRRDAKRNKIESDHAKRIKDVKRKLDALHENRRTQRAKLQEAQWSRLHLLNERLYCLKIREGYF
ncbi:hypothetical protein DID88_005104 [Monilinia fructigena]|uniref:Uncharacterized protein n=1 Tax=Monilinia fructigena TaxID=38457 RepID=A0A395IW23_9HELO|nr:hypothetical protein DID88_005104 [Monilinia fructigena]